MWVLNPSVSCSWRLVIWTFIAFPVGVNKAGFLLLFSNGKTVQKSCYSNTRKPEVNPQPAFPAAKSGTLQSISFDPGPADSNMICHNFRRWEAEGILSSSRYLAMVRRAILSPCSFNTCMIFWSEKGFWGDSWRTSSLIFSLTDKDDTSKPSTDSKPLVKKYFNSNNPLGVCTYLWVVTRL